MRAAYNRDLHWDVRKVIRVVEGIEKEAFFGAQLGLESDYLFQIIAGIAHLHGVDGLGGYRGR